MEFSFFGLHTTQVQCDLSWPAKAGSAFFTQVSCSATCLLIFNWWWVLLSGSFHHPSCIRWGAACLPWILHGVWRKIGPLTLSFKHPWEKCADIHWLLQLMEGKCFLTPSICMAQRLLMSSGSRRQDWLLTLLAPAVPVPSEGSGQS